jgi:hypothetical protein
VFLTKRLGGYQSAMEGAVPKKGFYNTKMISKQRKQETLDCIDLYQHMCDFLFYVF